MSGPLLLAVVAVAVVGSSGIFALALPRAPRLGQRLSTFAFLAGAGLGLAAAAGGLAGPPRTAQLAWSVPLGSLALRLDSLSALFLVPVLAIPALGSIYGLAYWPQAALGGRAVRLQLGYGLITAAMALTLLADDGVLFLVAWEVMALAAFSLVVTEQEKDEPRKAGLVYLAASHAGAFALFGAFAWIASWTGSFQFSAWRGLGVAGPEGVALWALLLVGFGSKAGLMPLHFWLPEAHAAAPSHVSALMSGVLIKTGLYGILRLSGVFAAPPPALGAAVLGLGIASAVLGVAFALAQHDLKRLLAYHSVENVGIIAMGVGLALLGRARRDPAMALLGFAGAALHVVNHATFKSLLFLGAGAVHRACGTRDIDHLGGLSRRMPRTAFLFLAGAVAISGLPPLNGFVSEWLVFLGSLRSLSAPRGDLLALAVLAVPALGLVGGLAAACFVKVQGAVFLGIPRSGAAERAHEAPPPMLLPMAVLAAACAAIGLAPAAVLPPLERAAAEWAGLPAGAMAAPAADAAASAWRVSLTALALLLALGALWLLRRAWLRGPQPRAETWGCGFTAPTARMQYTGSSFAEMLVQRFLWAFRPRVSLTPPRGLFPRQAAFAAEVPDTVLDRWLLPALRAGEALSARLRALFPAAVHFQAVLVLATLVVLLAWRFLLP